MTRGQPPGPAHILTIMERIIRQEIPAVVVDNPTWTGIRGQRGQGAPGREVGEAVVNAREADKRYATLLNGSTRNVRWTLFAALPHLHRRRFFIDREMQEKDVEGLLTPF